MNLGVIICILEGFGFQRKDLVILFPLMLNSPSIYKITHCKCSPVLSSIMGAGPLLWCEWYWQCNIPWICGTELGNLEDRFELSDFYGSLMKFMKHALGLWESFTYYIAILWLPEYGNVHTGPSAFCALWGCQYHYSLDKICHRLSGELYLVIDCRGLICHCVDNSELFRKLKNVEI